MEKSSDMVKYVFEIKISHFRTKGKRVKSQKKQSIILLNYS